MKSIDKIYSLHDCKMCKNTRTVPFIDKVLGKRTKDCECVSYQSRLNNLRRARLPDSYIIFEYKDYDTDIAETVDERTINKQSKTALGQIIKKHKIVNENGIDVLLYGPKACGKTMLGTVYLKTMILKHGYTGLFTTGEELILMAMEKSNFKSDDTFNGLTLEALLQVDFLMIDGFDKLLNSKIYPMVKVTINTILKQRKYNKKKFILTSETDLSRANEFVSEMVYTLKSLPLKGCCVEKVREDLDKTLGL